MVSVFVSISRMVCMWCLGHHDAVQLLTYTCMELCTCILTVFTIFLRLYVAMQVPRLYLMLRKTKIYCSLNNSILYCRQIMVVFMYILYCVCLPFLVQITNPK